MGKSVLRNFLLSLVLLVAPALAWAAEPPTSGATLPLLIELRDSAGANLSIPPESSITATADDGTVVKRPIGDVTHRLSLSAEGRWRLCLSATELWSDCQLVDVRARAVDAVDETLTVRFTGWPAATIGARIRTAKEGESPGRLAELLRVWVGPPPGQRPPAGFVDTQAPCTVVDSGSFSCSVPATPLYAAVRLSGFVSRYFWDLAPKAGEALDLGIVLLERGASLAGELDMSVEGLEPERITVHLIPASGPETGRAAAGALAKDVHVGTVTRLGFFQFGGIRPGNYMLEARHPGFAATRLGPFQVFDSKETRLRDLVRLEPPVDVSILIEPPLTPAGDPWQVLVSRERDWSSGADRVFAGKADVAGAVEIPQQSPGLFRIMLSDAHGNRFHSSSAMIEAGQSGFIPVTVPIVRLNGRIRLGEDPLAATLRFGGAHGELRSTVTADEDGEFTAFLARDGVWVVDIDSAEPALQTARRIDITAGADLEAEVEIVLDDTELIGRVVSPDGEPVDGAQVKVDALSELVSRRARTDEAGEFRFRALPAGAATVSAHAEIGGRKATATPVTVALAKGMPSGPVELVLAALHEFTGSIVSPSGPSPGARIHASSLQRALPAAASTLSDFDGRFVLEFPYEDGVAAFTMLPPGGFLSTSVQRLEDPLILRTASAGGELRVRAPSAADARYLLAIEREGVNIALPFLIEWNRGHGIHFAPPAPGETMVFPRMAEGTYRVCAVDEATRRRRIEEGANWQEIDAAATRCASGTLPPGGTLELSLDGE